LNSEIINGLFALCGASVGVMGAWLISRANKEKHEVTLLISPISKLLDVGDIAKSDVKITYKDSLIEGLCAGEFAVQNSGNIAVENISIDILPKEKTQILDLEKTSSNFLLKSDSVKFMTSNEKDIIEVDYLNPSDRIVFTYRIAGNEQPVIVLRKKGLEVKTKSEAINWVPDIYAEVLFGNLARSTGLSWYFSMFSKPFKLYLEAKREKT
jgi:hypothetical protein